MCLVAWAHQYRLGRVWSLWRLWAWVQEMAGDAALTSTTIQVWETIALRRCPPRVTCSGELWISFDSSEVPPANTSRMNVLSKNWSTTSSSTRIFFFQRNRHISRTHRYPLGKRQSIWFSNRENLAVNYTFYFPKSPHFIIYPWYKRMSHLLKQHEKMYARLKALHSHMWSVARDFESVANGSTGRFIGVGVHDSYP